MDIGAHHASMRERIARRRRDASLLRVGTVTKAIGAGTVAAVGALGLYVGKALPGHHTTTTPATSGAAGNGAPSTSTPASPSSGVAGSASAPPTTLAPAPTPPVRSPSRSVVSTGAS